MPYSEFDAGAPVQSGGQLSKPELTQRDILDTSALYGMMAASMELVDRMMADREGKK